MHLTVYLTLAASLAAVAVGRARRTRLRPRTASWALVVAAAALAVAGAVALALVASPIPARIPLIASLGRWRPQSIGAESPVPVWASVLALVALVVVAVRVGRELMRLRSELADLGGLHRELEGAGRGPVVVVRDPQPHAHALTRTVTRPGRVVVSTGLLDHLDGPERAAVVAHERAHLRHGHVLFVAVMRLAVALDPLLAPLRGHLELQLERWADEDAAAATTRPVAASAVARSALASLGAGPEPAGLALGLGGPDVAARVSALLDEPPPASRRAWLVLGVALAACAALAHSLHDAEVFFETARLWRPR